MDQRYGGLELDAYHLHPLAHGQVRPSGPWRASRLNPIRLRWGLPVINNWRARWDQPSRTNSLFHLLRDFLMNSIAEVLNAAFTLAQNNRGGIIWGGPARFRVNSDEV